MALNFEIMSTRNGDSSNCNDISESLLHNERQQSSKTLWTAVRSRTGRFNCVQKTSISVKANAICHARYRKKLLGALPTHFNGTSVRGGCTAFFWHDQHHSIHSFQRHCCRIVASIIHRQTTHTSALDLPDNKGLCRWCILAWSLFLNKECIDWNNPIPLWFEEEHPEYPVNYNIKPVVKQRRRQQN